MQRGTIIASAIVAIIIAALAVLSAWLLIRGPRYHPLDLSLYVHDADPERGRRAMIAYGCGACHVIPHVPGAVGRVGPELTGMRQQVYLAGRLANTPDNLIQWIQNPHAIDPRNAMPNLNVTEQDARDIAAFLYATP